jgi:SHS2 domain-containing protein
VISNPEREFADKLSEPDMRPIRIASHGRTLPPQLAVESPLGETAGCDLQPACSMSYRWLEHTAELELEVEAATEKDVFVDALRALAEVLGNGVSSTPVAREILLSTSDPAALLAQWIDELVFLGETEDLVAVDVDEFVLRDGELRAIVQCRRGNPRHLVKGATYHRLTFERSDRGVRATVVLDV